jgi:Tfp pilus assembly ATPase PilU
MSGMYSMKDLLDLVAQQGAVELRLESDLPPMILLHGKVRVLDGPLVTGDHTTGLLNGIVTAEQRRELDLCGSVHFTYAAEHSTHFSVRAGMHGKNVSTNIKNLWPLGGWLHLD